MTPPKPSKSRLAESFCLTTQFLTHDNSPDTLLNTMASTKKRLSHCRTSLPLCFVISLSCRVQMWGVWPSSGWGVVQVLHVCSTKNKNHEKNFFWRVWRHSHRILLQKFPTIRQCSKYETPYTFCTHSRWDANSCMTKYTNQRWIRVIDSLEHRFPPKRKGG